MVEKSTIKTYDDGVKDGKAECKKQMKNPECLEMYSEGYKSGFQDGYNAAREEIKEMMLTQMPPEIKKQIDEGAQPVGWVPWW
jgi:hypothetical protein